MSFLVDYLFCLKIYEPHNVVHITACTVPCASTMHKRFRVKKDNVQIKAHQIIFKAEERGSAKTLFSLSAEESRR